MAVLSLLVVLANVAFVTLALDIILLFAKIGIGLLINSSQLPTFGYTQLTVLPVTALFMLGQYWYMSRGVLRPSSVETDSSTVTALETRVTRLAAQASVQPPSVAVVNSSVPNCYTVGRRGNATIVVSTGLLETLDETERDAVLAHELAHVVNRDVTVMTMAVAPFRLARSLLLLLERWLAAIGFTVYVVLLLGIVFVTIIMILGAVLSWVSRAYDWVVTVAPLIDPGPIVGDGILNGGKELFRTIIYLPAGIATALFMAGVLLLPVVFAFSVYYVILGVIPRRLSMYREYAADRGAALITGNPAVVASALQTLSNVTDRPTDDLRHATDIQALCLIPDGITDEIEVGPIREWIAENYPWIDVVLRWIPTGIVAHPSIDNRIARLQDMNRTLEE